MQEDHKQEASQFVCKAVTDVAFRRLTLSVCSKVSAPYFEGSYAKAVQKSFEPWGVEVILKTTGTRSRLISTDARPSSERWITLAALKQLYAIDYKTLSSHLQSLTTREGQGLNGHSVILYNEAEAKEALSQYAESPKIDPKANQYIDENGKIWVTRSSLSNYGLSTDRILKSLLMGVPTIEGRAVTGVKTILYDEGLALQQLSTYLNLPKVGKTGRYIDETGRIWVTITSLATTFDISRNTLERVAAEMPSIEGRSDRGRRCNLCAEVEAKRFLSQQLGLTLPIESSVENELIPLPRVSKETRIFVDSHNESWAVAASFLHHIGINSNLTPDQLSGISFIEGRGANGRTAKLYNTRELLDAFSDLLNASVVDKETGEFTDKEGNIWVSQTYLCNLYGIGNSTINPYIASAATLKARAANGQLINLYLKKEMVMQLEGCVDSHCVDKDTKVFVDEQGASWATLQYFREKYGISANAIKNRFSQVPTMPGRDVIKKKAILYRISEGEIALRDFLALPRLDQNQRFTDDNNHFWVTANFLRDKYKTNEKMLVMIMQEVAKMTGRDSIGNIRLLFDEEAALKIIQAEKSTHHQSKEDLQNALLQEYEQRLLNGQIMSYEEFMSLKGRKK